MKKDQKDMQKAVRFETAQWRQVEAVAKRLRITPAAAARYLISIGLMHERETAA